MYKLGSERVVEVEEEKKRERGLESPENSPLPDCGDAAPAVLSAIPSRGVSALEQSRWLPQGPSALL